MGLLDKVDGVTLTTPRKRAVKMKEVMSAVLCCVLYLLTSFMSEFGGALGLFVSHSG